MDAGSDMKQGFWKSFERDGIIRRENDPSRETHHAKGLVIVEKKKQGTSAMNGTVHVKKPSLGCLIGDRTLKSRSQNIKGKD